MVMLAGESSPDTDWGRMRAGKNLPAGEWKGRLGQAMLGLAARCWHHTGMQAAMSSICPCRNECCPQLFSGKADLYVKIQMCTRRGGKARPWLPTSMATLLPPQPVQLGAARSSPPTVA